MVLVAMANTFSAPAVQSSALNYTAFIAKVRAGEIERVTISGNQISGDEISGANFSTVCSRG